MVHEFNVVIEKDEDGYFVASVPALRGCHTQASSLDVLIKRIKEAVELYLETLSEDERKDYLSKEILTTALEVQIA